MTGFFSTKHWRKEVGVNLYPVLRLLLPQVYINMSELKSLALIPV